MLCFKCDRKITNKNYVFSVGKKQICKKCFNKMILKHGEFKALRKLARE